MNTSLATSSDGDGFVPSSGVVKDSGTTSTGKNTEVPTSASESAAERTSFSPTVSARMIAFQLLQLCRCPSCKQPVHEPVTLPCGHSACYACVVNSTAHATHGTHVNLPSTSLVPPRFPLSTTTVPCLVNGCTRSAIGRGIGSWTGFSAVYGEDADHRPIVDVPLFGHASAAFASRSSGMPPMLEGFIAPSNTNSTSLGVASAQSRASFADSYMISKYTMESKRIADETAMLRMDVTLTKAVDILRRVAGLDSGQWPMARSGQHSNLPRSPRAARIQARARRRQAGMSAQTNHSDLRTEIDPRFLAVMGASEEGIDTGAVGGVSAVEAGDTDSEDEDSQHLDTVDTAVGTLYDGQDGTTDYDDDDDDEIGGAYARKYDSNASQSFHAGKRIRRHTLLHQQRRNVIEVQEDPVERAYMDDLQLSQETTDARKNAIDALHTDLLDILECQLCYMPLYKPLTTPCGHTFCRRCFARSLDHATTCPLCRADMPAFSFFQEHPCNEAILKILTAKIVPPTSTNTLDSKLEHLEETERQSSLWGLAQLYEERQMAIEREERESLMSTPIFVCTLGFPQMPTILHIFEPRYRLMVRRCLESGQPRFGMVLHSQNMSGTTPGMLPYGTMLEIKTVKMLPDGRSMIETVGSHRFKLLEKGGLDGYTVGRIVTIEDVPLHAEAELEQASVGNFDLWHLDALSASASAEERSDERDPSDAVHRARFVRNCSNSSNASSNSSGGGSTSVLSSPSSAGIAPYLTLSEAREAHDAFQQALGLDSLQRQAEERASRHADAATAQATRQLTRIGVSDAFVQRPTVELIEACRAFIETLRSGSAPWLITRLNDTYGPMPETTDIAAFGYWMAMIMPIDEHEKAKLLPIRSARLRLCIVVQWIEQLRQMWWFNNGCSVM